MQDLVKNLIARLAIPAAMLAAGAASAIHAVLWEHGRVIKLGNLGGEAWNTPMAINDRGEVVGFSNVAGDENAGPNFHAFVWSERGARCDRSHRHGRMCDLGTLKNGTQPDDTLSETLGVNASGQIVGVSYGGLIPTVTPSSGKTAKLRPSTNSSHPAIPANSSTPTISTIAATSPARLTIRIAARH